jgi:hypothetical protein
MEDNMVFMNRFYRSAALLLTALMLSVFVFTGCSSSDDDAQISLPAPNNMALTPKSGSLLVQFSRIDGIGTEGSQNGPNYEVSIGTNEDGSDKELLGEVLAVSSNLVRFHIVRFPTGAESGKVFYYPQLEDGQQYWIFVRTNFASSGYGYSPYAKLSAVPIPMPTPVDNVSIDFGDKRIVIKWDAKEYEEYGINVGDCPRNNAGHLAPGFWGITGAIVSGDNYVHTLTDNVATYTFCLAATNVNGNGEWYIFGDTTVSPIVYTPYTGQAATFAPDEPEVTIVKNANKRVDISFPAVLTGAKSVSAYEYAYQEQGGTWSNWEGILISSLTGNIASAYVSNLLNNRIYDIKVRAINTVDTVEGAAITGAPAYIAPNLNNPDEYLGKATLAYIYAEDVPHSDFWRISTDYRSGGRPGTDRLVRGKETALGNLYADAVQWYTFEQFNPDFSWLIGDIINTGIQRNQVITPKFLSGITNQDFIDDTIVIATVLGSDLITDLDYELNLNDYPAVGTNNGYTTTLFGQAAAVYRNGHYGGSGGTVYNGVYWGMPSKEARYTIEYLPYDLEEFNDHFNSKPACVAARALNNGAYNSKDDNDSCYLMPYAAANPVSGAPTDESIKGYKRGRIQEGSLFINGAAIDPIRPYKIATTKRIADSHYVAFLRGPYVDTGVTLLQAVAEYVYDTGNAVPLLDGRVKIEGGVPGDSSSDYTPPTP